MSNKKKKLTSMTIDEISFVNKGANQKADVLIFKSEEDVLKSYFTEALQSMLNRAEYQDLIRDICDDIWSLNDAFREALGKITQDETIEDKETAIKETLLAFASAIATMVDVSDTDMSDEYIMKVFNGNKVKLPSSALLSVKRKVREAYKEAYPDKKSEEYPEVLKLDINKGNDDMSEELKKQLDETLAANEALVAENKKLAFVAKLDSASRAIFDSLKDEEKADLLAKDFNDAVSDISKKAKEDEVITLEGVEIHKADVTEAQFNIMKSMSTKLELVEKARQEEVAKVELMEFSKKADEEYPNVIGTSEEKGKMLKAVSALPADVQKSLTEILKSYNEAIAKGFVEIGTTVAKDIASEVDPVAKSAKFFEEKYKKENK